MKLELIALQVLHNNSVNDNEWVMILLMKITCNTLDGMNDLDHDFSRWYVLYVLCTFYAIHVHNSRFPVAASIPYFAAATYYGTRYMSISKTVQWNIELLPLLLLLSLLPSFEDPVCWPAGWPIKCESFRGSSSDGWCNGDPRG